MRNRIKDSKSEILICKAKYRAAENPTQKSAERSAICPTETINDLVSDLRDKILNLEEKGDTDNPQVRNFWIELN